MNEHNAFKAQSAVANVSGWGFGKFMGEVNIIIMVLDEDTVVVKAKTTTK